jgi:hypothetical protein
MRRVISCPKRGLFSERAKTQKLTARSMINAWLKKQSALEKVVRGIRAKHPCATTNPNNPSSHVTAKVIPSTSAGRLQNFGN